jgi:hypothetical protein
MISKIVGTMDSHRRTKIINKVEGSTIILLKMRKKKVKKTLIMMKKFKC